MHQDLVVVGAAVAGFPEVINYKKESVSHIIRKTMVLNTNPAKVTGPKLHITLSREEQQ